MPLNKTCQTGCVLFVDSMRPALLGMFLILGIGMMNCKDDKGGGPDVEPGTLDATISGSVNLDLSGGKAEYIDSTVLISPGIVTQADYIYMTWRKNDKQITTAFTYGESEADTKVEEIETGTYTSKGETEFVEVTVQLDSTGYEMSRGAVSLTNIKETSIEGDYEDVVLEQKGGAKDSIRLSGSFKALEKGGK
jgi:hypothetical protein